MSAPELPKAPEPIKELKVPKYAVGTIVRYSHAGLTVIAKVGSIRQQIITKTKGDAEWFYFLDSPITTTAVPESLLTKV